ncbi:MAG: hypothetical protein D6805_01795, partial [Planctomycetota bacterium]
MDENLGKNFQKEVQSIIKRNTSKVSLRDLEKRGFKNVKVLRQNDINLLIKQAIHTVLGENPQSSAANQKEAEEERQRYFEQTKKELDRLMKQQMEERKALAQLQQENQVLRQKTKELEQKLRTQNPLAASLGKMAEPAGASAQKIKSLEEEVVRLRRQLKE